MVWSNENCELVNDFSSSLLMLAHRSTRVYSPVGLFERGAGLGHAAIDLVERLLQLDPPPVVGRGRKLPLELGAGQAQRLERPHLFRIAHHARAGLRALPLELFHPLLDSAICVDQTFACITHALSSRCGLARRPVRKITL